MFHELKLYISGTCDEVRNTDEETLFWISVQIARSPLAARS